MIELQQQLREISHAVIVENDSAPGSLGSIKRFQKFLLTKSHNLRCVKPEQAVLVTQGLSTLSETGYLHVIGTALFKGNVKTSTVVDGKCCIDWNFEMVETTDAFQHDVCLHCSSSITEAGTCQNSPSSSSLLLCYVFWQ